MLSCHHRNFYCGDKMVQSLIYTMGILISNVVRRLLNIRIWALGPDSILRCHLTSIGNSTVEIRLYGNIDECNKVFMTQISCTTTSHQYNCDWHFYIGRPEVLVDLWWHTLFGTTTKQPFWVAIRERTTLHHDRLLYRWRHNESTFWIIRSSNGIKCGFTSVKSQESPKWLVHRIHRVRNIG